MRHPEATNKRPDGKSLARVSHDELIGLRRCLRGVEIQKSMEAPTENQAVQFEQFIDEAKKHHAEFVSCASESLKAAALCGQALIRARGACEQNQWLNTLKRYWPELSRTTAYRYIDIAENSHTVGNLEDLSQRGLLRIIGKAPESDSSATKSVVITVEAFERFSHKIEAGRAELLTWPEDKRQKLKTALRPIVDVYESLAADGVVDV